MGVISGRAKKYDGTAIDYVAIYEWRTGNRLGKVIPAADGSWSFSYSIGADVGLLYVADGCEPISHGAYNIAGDANQLIVNGEFINGLDGWANTNNHWKWVSGSAYHALNSNYLTLTQVINSTKNIKVVIDIEVLKGSVGISLYSTRYLFGTNNYGVGRHTIEFTVKCEPNATFYFGRVAGAALEMYIHSVSAVELD